MIVFSLIVIGALLMVSTPTGKATLELMVSDEQGDIGDFDSLEVTLTKIRVFKAMENDTAMNQTGYQEFTPAVASFDLTELTGDNALSLINATLEPGKYTKIEFHVGSATGVVNNETMEVMVPSDKLMITKTFELVENQSTSFVFDINVVRKGNGGYNLLPVISESGVVGKDVPKMTRVRKGKV